jgi:hypothetical protein
MDKLSQIHLKKRIHVFECFFSIILVYILIIRLWSMAPWSRSYHSWIYNYLCNQCISPLKLYMYNYSTNTSTTTDWKFTYNTSHSWFKHMVFNATFNIISAISWRSVLLVEETGQTLSLYNVVLSTHRHEQDSNSQF